MLIETMVYFRRDDGGLGCFAVATNDHEDAIEQVNEVRATHEGMDTFKRNGPSLAVIDGGKE